MGNPLFKSVSGQNPREIAADLLSRRNTGKFIENLLADALRDSRMSPADRALCQELTYGVVRWRDTLDWLIARKTQNRPQHHLLKNLLRLGLYQIFWLERIPHHAAVNETVELARKHGFSSQSGFVNAVLRGYSRELDVTKKLLEDLKKAEPHLGYSHPEWLVTRWQKRFRPENTARLLEWNNTPPKIFARVNTLKTDAAKLLARWRNENVDYDFFRRDWVEENLVFELKSHPSLESIPSFQEGLFYVQDPSTLLAVRELEPKPGETIFDGCAAPGGKLSYTAQVMRNEGRIVAHDLNAERIKLLQENSTRLGLGAVEFTTHFPEAKPIFDRALIDAPCSNTGVLRRRVDLRWRIKSDEIQRLRSMQLELLSKTADVVKPGGVLGYSTCSLEPEENSEVIKEFVNAHPYFSLERERELLPFNDGVDGAYVARLKRNS